VVAFVGSASSSAFVPAPAALRLDARHVIALMTLRLPFQRPFLGVAARPVLAPTSRRRPLISVAVAFAVPRFSKRVNASHTATVPLPNVTWSTVNRLVQSFRVSADCRSSTLSSIEHLKEQAATRLTPKKFPLKCRLIPNGYHAVAHRGVTKEHNRSPGSSR